MRLAHDAAVRGSDGKCRKLQIGGIDAFLDFEEELATAKN